MTAEEVMNSPVLSCAPDWPVGRALDLMRERGISHLPVVEDERVVGLVSDRDLLQHSKEAETRVRTIMTNRLLTARPQSNLWLVARIMLDEVVHCVVIVDEDANLRGILTSLDLLGCMSHHAPIEVWM